MTGLTITGNFAEVIKSLEDKTEKVNAAMLKGATDWKDIGVAHIQSLTPVKTGALQRGYAEASTVEQSGDEVKITWDSNVDYQGIVEAKKPHCRPGVHESIPEGQEAIRKALEEAME